MYTKILGLLAGALVLGISLGGCEQPPITCRVAGGAFAAKYTLTSGDAMCLRKFGQRPDDSPLAGEVVGMQGYSGLGAVSEGGPDLSVKRVAIQSESVGDRYYATLEAEEQLSADFIADNAEKGLYSIGNLTDTVPADDNSCVAPTLEGARIATLAIPRRDNLHLDPPLAKTCLDGMQNGNETGVDCGGAAASDEEAACAPCACFNGVQDIDDDLTDVDEGEDAVDCGRSCEAFSCPEPVHDIGYTWTNINVHVTGTTPGTAMTATLEYSDIGCSATYSVRGLFPAVECETTADCLIAADPEAGIATGSGINPALFDYVICDPEMLYCVLTADPVDLP